MSSKIRSMKRKMDRETAIPTRRVQVMEDIWQNIVQLAKMNNIDPTMMVNRVLADFVGQMQERAKKAQTTKDSLVTLPGDAVPVTSELQRKIIEAGRG